MDDRNDTDDGSTDPFGEPPAPGERVERSDDGSALVREHPDGTATFAFDPESDFGAKIQRATDERGEDAEEFIRDAIAVRLDNDKRGNASERDPGLDRDEPESYDPAKKITPEELHLAMATLSPDEFEEFNRIGTDDDYGGDPGTANPPDTDRTLVSLAGDRGERVMQIAWELDREPNEVLDELVHYAQLHYEEIFYPRPTFD